MVRCARQELTKRNGPSQRRSVIQGMQAARSEPSQATVDWVARVDFLRSSAVATDAPEVRETHMSWVVMDRETVWKLKKPVRYPFLDFSTLAAREHACREEVRLNRRLAPEIYLDVVAIVRQFDGRLELGPADGEVVDWLVKMRRLPADRALDHAIRVSTVTISQIDALAECLATFYRAAPAAGLGAAAYASRFAAEQSINRDVLLNDQLQAGAGGCPDHARRVRAGARGVPWAARQPRRRRPHCRRPWRPAARARLPARHPGHH
jgi:uncharacterized protein